MAGDGKICAVADWGEQPYARACAWQQELVARRKAGELPNLLVLCTHPHVITLGRNACRENLRLPEALLPARGVEVHATDRGGDVTYHGPGQLVGYPILDLSEHRKDVVWYVRALEEVLIRAAGEFGVEAARKAAPTYAEASAGRPANKRQLYTGVWVGEEKLAAIGVHVSRWVTSHGFAFNVTTDLSYFDLIVPCGLADKGVTSLAQLLASPRENAAPNAPSPQAPAWGSVTPSCGGRWAEQPSEQLMEAAKAAVVKHFAKVFNREMRTVAAETWEAWVGAYEVTAT